MVLIQIQVGILKRVLEEVEKVMNEFKSMLFKSMEDPQMDLTTVSFLFLHFTPHIGLEFLKSVTYIPSDMVAFHYAVPLLVVTGAVMIFPASCAVVTNA